MKTTEFCYWLQGLFELQPDVADKGLTPAQTVMVQRHLALVFKHDIDPSYSPDPAKQAEMHAIHDGKPYVPMPPPRPRGCFPGGNDLIRC